MNDDIAIFIQACIDGDADSWRELRSMALQLLKRRYPKLAEDHEDIAQEIVAKLHKTLRQFQGTTKYQFIAYFGTIVRNTKTSYCLQPAHRNADESLDQPINDDDDLTPRDLLRDERLDPATIAEINDLYRKASAKLSIRDQQILLYKVEDYPDGEIAEILGMTSGGVAVTYNRIKTVLRKALLQSVVMIFLGREFP